MSSPQTFDRLRKTSQTHRYWVIDCCRFYCACLVVIIHCLEAPWKYPFWSMIVACFSQQAVPFFFIVSGFFFARKMAASDRPAQTIIGYVKKQLLLYFAWMVIELPGMIQLYRSLYPGVSPVYLGAVIFRRIFLCGQGVYWYLLILAESALFAGVCMKKQKEKLLYAVGIMGLVLGYIYDAQFPGTIFEEMNHIFYFVFSWSNNFLMKGIPYIAFGVFAFHHLRNKPLKRGPLVCAYIMVGVISAAVFMYLSNHHAAFVNKLFFYPILAVILFLFAIQPTCKTPSPGLDRHFRGISSTMYFTHTIFIYQFLDKFWPITASMLFRFSVAVLLPVLVYFIAIGTRWKPLKWLLGIS